MFDNFKAAFCLDDGVSSVGPSSSPATHEPLAMLLARHGGQSFNQGIYRILASDSIDHWNAVVLSAFPGFAGRITCFGVDWLGRCFAVDSARSEEGKAGVLMFEPGTGEALAIPCNILTFHESELIQYREPALAEMFFQKWLVQGGASPSVAQCIGYKRPLFLGGADTVENLELSDLDVYWTIAAELIRKVKGLPIGTPISQISIK